MLYVTVLILLDYNAESVVESHYKRIFRELPTEGEYKDIENFISMGVQESLICRALDIGEAKGAGTWAYTEGIIRNWIESGIFSLGDLEKKKSKEENAKKREKKKEETNTIKPKNKNEPDKYLPPKPLPELL